MKPKSTSIPTWAPGISPTVVALLVAAVPVMAGCFPCHGGSLRTARNQGELFGAVLFAPLIVPLAIAAARSRAASPARWDEAPVYVDDAPYQAAPRPLPPSWRRYRGSVRVACRGCAGADAGATAIVRARDTERAMRVRLRRGCTVSISHAGTRTYGAPGKSCRARLRGRAGTMWIRRVSVTVWEGGMTLGARGAFVSDGSSDEAIPIALFFQGEES